MLMEQLWAVTIWTDTPITALIFSAQNEDLLQVLTRV